MGMLSDCKYESAVLFDSIEGDLPNLHVENFLEEAQVHEVDLFNELRGRFIRTQREWPMCDLHGAVRLYSRVARDFNRGRVYVKLFFGCRTCYVTDHLEAVNSMNTRPASAGESAGVAGPHGS